MNQLLDQYPAEVKRILAKYPEAFKRSAVMPLLYLAQRETGIVPPEAVQEIASLTGVSATDVASIIGFYTLFHEEAGGRYRIQVCTDLPCLLRGAGKFLEELCALLGIQPGQTTPDGLFTLEEVKCLAACHRAPMFQVQGEGEIVFHENQSTETARLVIDELRLRAADRARKEAA